MVLVCLEDVWTVWSELKQINLIGLHVCLMANYYVCALLIIPYG